MVNRYSKTRDLYNRISEAYSQKIKSKQRKRDIEKIKSLLSAGDTILDIGCAAGRDSQILKGHGFNITGIDFSEKLLEIARSNNPDIEFITADMRKLPFNDEVFDCLFASAVFHHLEKKDMAPTLEEWNRVLKKSGLLYLTTKNGTNLMKTSDSLSEESREFTLLTLNEVGNMLAECGFEKIELRKEKSHSHRIDWNIAFYRKAA